MNKHPKLPYTHNLNKKCKIDGCEELGYPKTCTFCRQKKLSTLCERHLMFHKEMNRAARGKLTAGINLRDIKDY